ncbi:MAG: hypothetical protein JSR54_06675, partial [Proteobacteria bacterium]|nr:hypothetical protein [Pseudomonadota bacterium]
MTRGEVRIERLTTRSAFDALRMAWDDLLQRADHSSPFLTPGWQAAWLDSYGAGRSLWVLAAYRQATLVGLWPLCLRRQGPFRVLEPIGAGRSDWLEALIASGERDAVLDAFLAELAAARRQWDLLELRDVLDGSPLPDELTRRASGQALTVHSSERTAAPYLTLSADWEGFLSSKRPKFRSNLKYYRRLPERDGKTLRLARAERGAAVGAVDELASIELRSWKAKSGNLKISTPAGRAFYAGFLGYFDARGELDLWRAELDGRLFA